MTLKFILIYAIAQSSHIFTMSSVNTKENTAINSPRIITGISGTIPALIEQTINLFNNLPKDYPIRNRFKNRLLLYGPTGNGKTTLASIFAQETNSEFIEISSTSIVNAYQSSGPAEIDRIFNGALKTSFDTGRRVVILFDEVEAFASNHTTINYHQYRLTVAHFWMWLDKLKKNQNIFIIVATNKFKHLDPAFANRFKTLEIPNPDDAKRREIINYFIKDINKEGDIDFKIEPKKIDLLVNKTKDLSIRSIEDIITAISERNQLPKQKYISTKKLIEEERQKPIDIAKEETLSKKWQENRDIIQLSLSAIGITVGVIGIIIAIKAGKKS